MKIMIADDFKAIRSAVAGILSRHSGWEVCGEAESGPEAVEKAKELHPDLILVDVSMPNFEKSGLDRLKELAKDKKSTVVLTGEIAEANSALLQGAIERKNNNLELASEGETVGG